MDIESKIKREGGTHVDMGTAKYHFAPLEDGAHVAAVDDQDHQDRFLSIPEGYRAYRGAGVAAAAAPVVQVDPVAAPSTPVSNILLGSDEHPASFEIHGKTYSLGDIVAQAHAASGLDVNEWNGLAADSRAGMIDDVLDQIDQVGAEPPQSPQPPVNEEWVRAELVAQFETKFGKKPHHNAGIDSIRAKLAEA